MAWDSLSKSDFGEICRTCLSKNLEFTKIESIKSEVYDMFLQMNINNVSSPENFNSEFPNQVCSTCLNKMELLHEFKLLCMKSNDKLIEISKLKDCSENSDSELDLNNDFTPLDNSDSVKSENEVNENVLECQDCNKTFENAESFQKHMQKHEIRYLCDICDTKLSDLHSLVNHVRKQHETEPIPCSECSKTFVVKEQLNIHMRKHAPEQKHVCPDCGKVYLKRYLLRKHQKHHVTERNFHCLKCEKSFRVEATLKLHEKRVHNGQKHYKTCNICGKSVVHLRGHMETHHSDKRYNCDRCPKFYTTKYALEAHRTTIHENPSNRRRPYLCNICGKGSYTTTALRLHFEHMHSDGITYPCPICQKHFKTDKSVKKHQKLVHEGDRRYKCTVCAKCFQTSTTLNIHMRVHTGERPYPCKLCEKTFKQASTLKTHMKVHGVERTKGGTDVDLAD